MQSYVFCPANFVVILNAHDSLNLNPQENALWQLVYSLTKISPVRNEYCITTTLILWYNISTITYNII